MILDPNKHRLCLGSKQIYFKNSILWKMFFFKNGKQNIHYSFLLNPFEALLSECLLLPLGLSQHELLIQRRQFLQFVLYVLWPQPTPHYHQHNVQKRFWTTDPFYSNP